MTKATLLWMDLEMTGLDPLQDRIMEVAAIATDWQFSEMATYEATIKVDDQLIAERMVGDFWQKFALVHDTLVANNIDGRDVALIEDELLDFVVSNFDGDNVILAGNSIHQDRKFIDREWPRLASKLHYRMLDVSAFKLVFEGKYRKKFAKPENHRALDDIRGSIEELKYYLARVRA